MQNQKHNKISGKSRKVNGVKYCKVNVRKKMYLKLKKRN